MPDRVDVCPYCRSPALSGAAMGRGSVDVWECNHCSYVGREVVSMPRDEVPDKPVPVEEVPERPMTRPVARRGPDPGGGGRLLGWAILVGLLVLVVWLMWRVAAQHLI